LQRRRSVKMKIMTLVLPAALLVLGIAIPRRAKAEMLEPGMPVPAFELEAHNGTKVSAASLKGSYYLLYFYPKADTPGCTKEACELRDHWSDVERMGLKVFGVSYDTPEDNAAFAEKYHLQFLLLSDREHTLAEAVGAARALLPVPKRISYLVGPDGAVLKAYPDVDPTTHAAEVLADLETLTGKSTQ